MRTATEGLAIVLLAAALLSASAAAEDVVVLQSGARVTGDVSVDGGAIRIATADGVLSVDASLVRRVIHTIPQASVPRAVAVAAPEPTAVPDGGGARVTTTEAALDRKVSIDFQDTALSSVIEYLQEISGANFSYRPSDLQAGAQTITLRLNDVRMRQVLDLALEGRGLGWDVREDVIRIRPEEELAGTAPIRTYDILDCLVNVEDRQGARAMTLSEQGGSSGSSSTNAAGGGSSASSWDFSNGGDDGGSGTTGSAAAASSQTLSARAFDFAELITHSVRPESWAEPAVEQFGGGKTNDQQTYDDEPW